MPLLRHLIATALAIVLLAACANVDVDTTAENFDEDTYADDLSECRGGPAMVFVADRLGTALIGSAYGLVHGVSFGSVDHRPKIATY